MQALKCTMLINATTNISKPNARHRTCGVSETFYAGNTSISTVQTAFETLCQARARMLPTGAAIVGQRYQTVNPVGPSVTIERSYQGGSGLTIDYPSNSLNIISKGVGVKNVRKGFIRLLPDVMIDEGELDSSGSSSWVGALTNFFVQLGSWYFRGDDLTVPAYPLISATAGTDPTTMAVITEGATTWAVGNIVVLQRMQNTSTDRLQSFRGKVTAIDGVTGIISVKLIKAANTSNFQGGKGRVSTTTFLQIAPTTVQGFSLQIVVASAGTTVGKTTSKKVGRPFFQFRGHATAKR